MRKIGNSPFFQKTEDLENFMKSPGRKWNIRCFITLGVLIDVYIRGLIVNSDNNRDGESRRWDKTKASNFSWAVAEAMGEEAEVIDSKGNLPDDWNPSLDPIKVWITKDGKIAVWDGVHRLKHLEIFIKSGGLFPELPEEYRNSEWGKAYIAAFEGRRLNPCRGDFSRLVDEEFKDAFENTVIPIAFFKEKDGFALGTNNNLTQTGAEKAKGVYGSSLLWKALHNLIWNDGKGPNDRGTRGKCPIGDRINSMKDEGPGTAAYIIGRLLGLTNMSKTALSNLILSIFKDMPELADLYERFYAIYSAPELNWLRKRDAKGGRSGAHDITALGALLMGLNEDLIEDGTYYKAFPEAKKVCGWSCTHKADRIMAARSFHTGMIATTNDIGTKKWLDLHLRYAEMMLSALERYTNRLRALPINADELCFHMDKIRVQGNWCHSGRSHTDSPSGIIQCWEKDISPMLEMVFKVRSVHGLNKAWKDSKAKHNQPDRTAKISKELRGKV